MATFTPDTMKKVSTFVAKAICILLFGFALEGCLQLGVNKNGFYCTEGPTDVAPSCFGHSAPKSPTSASPATATSLKKVDPSEP
ncbi:hypothetical protein HDE76_001245 [Rhodanobacter sp. ANJX3]|uniref:hypothetical protein n=1 Tax=Rhodanobacter sp. ANJX3 TaxID=2723083 RepID=UPI00160E39E1|nr:hypothetical protein [Rhodanobacter sp. ANJX3]MBB5358039.1 hypothetical protein [Rhodanobacter sp. ANJX3]